MRILTLAVACALASALLPGAARADTKAACVAASERGQTLRDDGAWTRARKEFQVCAADTCPPVVQRDCAHWLDELDQALPSVVLVVRDPAGDDLTEVRVVVDGAPFANRIDGKPIQLDPGAHVIRIEPPTLAPVEEHVTVHAGEKVRVVRFTTSANPPGASASAGAQPPPPLAPEPPPEGPAPHAHSPWPFILGGVGVAAIGSFAFFGISGRLAYDDLRNQPCHATATCSESDVRSIRTKFNVADVSLGIGIVTLAVATYIWIRESR